MQLRDPSAPARWTADRACGAWARNPKPGKSEATRAGLTTAHALTMACATGWGRHGGPILVLRATHSATGCVPWVWNDQTGNTNRLPIRRVDSPYMSQACCQRLKNAFFGSGAAMEVPSLY